MGKISRKLNEYMEKAKLLESSRLRLRPYIRGDLEFLHELGMDEEVMKYIRPVNYDIERTRAELEKMIRQNESSFTKGFWVAESRNSSIPLGSLTLRELEGSREIELGYRWKSSYWGKGYATEGALALLDFGFKHGQFEQILAVVHPDNLGSQRVLEKCGFCFYRMGFHYNFRVKMYRLKALDFNLAS